MIFDKEKYRSEIRASIRKWNIHFIINWKASHPENPLLWEQLSKDALITKMRYGKI